MNKFQRYPRLLAWVMTLGLSALAAGCGGGGKDPVLGIGDGVAVLTPTVIYTVPLDDSTGVAVNRKISATFSVPMVESTIIAPGTFAVKETVLGTAVTGTVAYDAASHIVLFTPDSPPLANDTEYTGTITTAAKSMANAALAGDYVWTFRTGLLENADSTDSSPPLLLSTDPADSDIDVPVNQIISASFNEPMDPTTICGPSNLTAACPVASFTVTCTAPVSCPTPAGTVSYSGTTATFTPSSSLQADATYSVVIAASDLAGNAWVAGGTQPPNPWSFTTGAITAVHLGPASVILGATQPYGVLSNTGVTLGGGPLSVTGFRVDGDVGISPAGACVGCDVTTVTGVIENGTVPASDAMVALTAAYNDAIGRTANVCTLIGSGILTTNPSATCGGSADGVFAPGLYWSATSIAIPAGGTITLDAQNDPSAVFIFQSESTINSIGGDTHVVLANQAQAKNVFWVAKSSATIGGTTSDFAGTVIALVAVTVNTGTQMEGRALARTAAVTVQDDALITVPAP